MTALRITDLVFRWPRQAQICLDIARFELAAGERVFLHGASGSGKSTLLGLLGGVALPQQGRIELLGTDITRLGSRDRDRFRADHIGFLFQQFNLLPWLPALDNVLLPCTFSARRRERAGADPRAEAERLLRHLDLDTASWRKPAGELSVGQQQRVAAARALLRRPALVLADEPTGNLDTKTADELFEQMRRFHREEGVAFLIVTHDPRLAERCDRKITLVDGRIEP